MDEETRAAFETLSTKIDSLLETVLERLDKQDLRFDKIEAIYRHQMQQINKMFNVQKASLAEQDASLDLLAMRVTYLEEEFEKRK